MEVTTPDPDKGSGLPKKNHKKFNLRTLRLSLKYRPEILKLILKMRQCIKNKSLLIAKLKRHMKLIEKFQGSSTKFENNDPNINSSKVQDCNNPATTIKSPKATDITQSNDAFTTNTTKVVLKDSTTQTEETSLNNDENTKRTTSIHTIDRKDECTEKMNENKDSAGWNINKSEDEGKSIAEQVKEAAQSALQQSGMVYVESAGMYYDYKTGYYYNSELGLYYHTDTGCYYYYSDEKKEFVFHSYPDRSALAVNASLQAHEKRKAKKHKKAQKTEEEIESLTKNLSQDKEDEATKPKRKKKSDEGKASKPQRKMKSDKKKETEDSDGTKDVNKNQNETDIKEMNEIKETDNISPESTEKEEQKQDGSDIADLEDGECSETESEKSDEEEGIESDHSTSTASDDDAVAKHHPPCMRVIVRDTNLPKLKVGTLFLVTKDGGTVGREGEQHTILLRDNNVSRTHLGLNYDMDKRMYMATDLGSKNGTLLNGIQMSESQVVSKPMEVIHGSTIQLGETRLLCHIHPGNDTCGHCEPGLLMETQEKEKVAYTRTCSVQKQYHMELARLKNKYTPERLMIEDGSYNDRAKARRETVGSSHHSEKTQSTDVETFIEPENKGFKLLEKMGWSKGEGLGKDSQGGTEPIPLVNNEGKAGLGTPGAVSAPPLVPKPRVRNTLGPATLRLATRSKLLQPPAKAFQDPLEEDSE